MARSKVKNLLLLKQIHKAVGQIKKGNLDKALETLDRAEKSARSANSTDALYYILFTRGGILYSAKKYDEALETYEKALEVGGTLLEKDPENSDYQHYMGTTLSSMGNLLKSKGDTPEPPNPTPSPAKSTPNSSPGTPKTPYSAPLPVKSSTTTAPSSPKPPPTMKPRKS